MNGKHVHSTTPHCLELFQIELTLHGPVVDGGLGNQGNGVEVDPLPEHDVLHHLMGLHLALHLNIEYLQTLPSYREREVYTS